MLMPKASDEIFTFDQIMKPGLEKKTQESGKKNLYWLLSQSGSGESF